MRFLLLTIAHVYVWLWWQVRVDPTGYVRRVGMIFGATTTLVVSAVGTVAVLANLLLFDIPAIETTAIAAVVPAVTSPPTTGAPKPKKEKKTPKPVKSKDAVFAASGPVPGTLFATYQDAARSCNMQWEVLAAVGWVESHHGELVAPGVKSGANFAGAKGPMQFLSATWNHYGVDANNDGKADVYDPEDAIHGASKYLCANGAGDPDRVRNALFVYNHSDAYVDEVISVARGYSEQTYLLPVPTGAVNEQLLSWPHHDYPAIDVMLPIGTPVVVAHGGKVSNIDDGRCGLGVVIAGYDGATYTYCHLSQRSTTDGRYVSSGDPLGKTGGESGEPGAGSSTTPHLHLQIDAGAKVCPQPLLKAWKDGRMAKPSDAPTSGCTS